MAAIGVCSKKKSPTSVDHECVLRCLGRWDYLNLGFVLPWLIDNYWWEIMFRIFIWIVYDYFSWLGGLIVDIYLGFLRTGSFFPFRN